MVKKFQIELLDLKFWKKLLLIIFINLRFFLSKNYFVELKSKNLNLSLFLNLQFIFLNQSFPVLIAHNLSLLLIIMIL